MGFIKTLFRPKIPSIQTPSVTGRDLVSSTSSEEPDSPQMGTEDKKKRQQGISSLLVQNENLYRGGV